IVKAHVNGQVWWLDPTNPVFMPGRSMPDIQNRWALVIDAEGKVYQDHIPEEQPSLSMAVKKFEHFNRDGQARTTAEVQMGQMTLMQLSF
ncbi:cysteine protease, partial [Salmonella enterica subsp. enterica]